MSMIKNMRFILFISLNLILSGCMSPLPPGLSLKDARMAEGPVLIERSGHVYLRYRRSLEEQGFTLLSLVDHRKTKEEAYYYFSIPISHAEWGNLVERPLAYDQTEDMARAGRVFWLDPDGTKHPIPFVKEPTQRHAPNLAPAGR